MSTTDELNTKLFVLCHGTNEPSRHHRQEVCELRSYTGLTPEDAFAAKRQDRLARVLPAIDAAGVEALLLQGAQGGYVKRTEGIWGAHEQSSALHGLLRNCFWQPAKLSDWEQLRMNSLEVIEERELSWGGKEKVLVHKDLDGRILFDLAETEAYVEATLSRNLAAVQLMLKHGAKPTAEASSSDWRGCGGGSTAFSQVQRLCMSNLDDKNSISANVVAITKRYREQMFSSFLQDSNAPALLSKGQSRSIHSMRSDGFTKSGTLHELCSSGQVAMLRLVLARLREASAEQGMATIVDMLKVEHVMNERGYHTDSHETPLHLALEKCPSCFQPLDADLEEVAKRHRVARKAERAAARAREAARRAKWREGRPKRRADRRAQRSKENEEAAVCRDMVASLKAFREAVAAESMEQRQARLAAWKADGVYQYRKVVGNDEEDEGFFDDSLDGDTRFEHYDEDFDYQERDWLVAPAGLDARKRLGDVTTTRALDTILSLYDDRADDGFLPLNSVSEEQGLDSKSLDSESSVESSDEPEVPLAVDVKIVQEQNTANVQRFQKFLQVSSLLLDAGADPNKIRATLMQVPNPECDSSTTDDPRLGRSPVLYVRLLQSPLSLALPRPADWEEPPRLPDDFGAFALVYLLVLKGADLSLGSFQGKDMLRSCWSKSGRAFIQEENECADRLALDCCQGRGDAPTKGKRQPLPGMRRNDIPHTDVEHRYLSALHGQWSPDFFQLHPAELQESILVLFMALKRHGIGSTLAAQILGDCLAMNPVARLFA